MQANGQDRLGTIDSDGEQYISDDVLDALDAYQHLALQRGLWIISGWTTSTCECGCSITARKGDLRRTVVAIPVEDIPLVLAPQSLDAYRALALVV